MPIASGRNALTAFFLSGLLMSFPGAILPAWGYHLSDSYLEIGRHFLAMAVGLLAAATLGTRWIGGRGPKTMLVAGCGVAMAGFVSLALAGPPVTWHWRGPGLALTGLAAGLLNAGAFRAISGLYARDKAATVNLAGILFGLGCLVMALVVAGTFYVYRVGNLLAILALFCGLSGILYWQADIEAPAVEQDRRKWREVWTRVRSPGAVMFAVLLFFQFANEWSIAGWLAVFLVHRIGVSPDDSILMLAGFWGILLAGRVCAQALLEGANRPRMLTLSTLAAVFGCSMLAATNNRFGAWTALVFLGGGFAGIYPLVVERIGHRFPDYHPGFFNGLLSIGLAAGLLAPWMVSFVAAWGGVAWVMLLPAVGTGVVLVLTGLIWLEAKFSGVSH